MLYVSNTWTEPRHIVSTVRAGSEGHAVELATRRASSRNLQPRRLIKVPRGYHRFDSFRVCRGVLFQRTSGLGGCLSLLVKGINITNSCLIPRDSAEIGAIQVASENSISEVYRLLPPLNGRSILMSPESVDGQGLVIHRGVTDGPKTDEWITVEFWIVNSRTPLWCVVSHLRAHQLNTIFSEGPVAVVIRCCTYT
jgi:hypothetical protein